MAKKDDHRYKIDTLIKIASTTADRTLREECCVEAKNLLEDVHDNVDSVVLFLHTYYEFETDGRVSRGDVWDLYNHVRANEDYPYLTRNALYRRIREQGIAEIKSCGEMWFLLKEKCSVFNQGKEK